jgi:flagellar basal body P-ring formation protein FlgA
MNRLRFIAGFLFCAALATTSMRSEGSSAPTALDRTEFIAALSRDLSSHFRLEGELQLELLRPWTAPAKTASSWETVILEYPSAPASSMLVRCRALADGAPAGEFTLVLRAALWRDVWVARQPLAPGAIFDPALLDVRRVDGFREHDSLPTAAGDKSYVMARAVTAGRLLTWRDVSRRPLVRKGETVEVAAIYGQLLVTLKGLAMENGVQGEIVTVRNPDSRKDFSATVIDENRVQVRF